MRKSAVYALRQALKEGFVILLQRELEALDALPGWMTRLYTALLRCSDYGTGKGDTSYANLQALMTPIQPRSGPKHFVPDLQAIKKAVRLMEQRQLLTRDKLHSQDQSRLLFMTIPRYEKVRPKAELEPLTRTPVDNRKAKKHAASSGAVDGTRTPNSNPSSTVNLSHIKEAELSTCGQPRPPEPDDPPGPIVFGAVDQKIGPPRGADTSPQAGTPPRQSRYARQVLAAAQKMRKIAPPGGNDDAPQGDPAQLPPSERIKRTRKTVLKGGAGEVSGDQLAQEHGQNAPDRAIGPKVCTFDEWPWPDGK